MFLPTNCFMLVHGAPIKWPDVLLRATCFTQNAPNDYQHSSVYKCTYIQVYYRFTKAIPDMATCSVEKPNVSIFGSLIRNF